MREENHAWKNASRHFGHVQLRVINDVLNTYGTTCAHVVVDGTYLRSVSPVQVGFNASMNSCLSRIERSLMKTEGLPISKENS